MSDVQQNPAQPELSLIQKYQIQLHNFKQQREQLKAQFEQLSGAIFACESMIKQYEDDLIANAKKVAQENSLSKENLGDQENGEAKCEETECVA